MNRLRFIGIVATALLVLALPAIAAAADVAVAGTVTGSAVAQPPEAGVAECTPTTATAPEDFVCDFDVDGTFDLTGIGTGTYDGALRLDWSIYTTAAPCAEATGTLTLTTADGTLDLDVEDSSRVCETATATAHAATLDMTVSSGTGDFAGATGTLAGVGTMTAAETGYDTDLDVTGTITVVAASSVAPSVTPSPTPASVAPSSAVTSPTPAAMLPDTALGTQAPMAALAAILALTLAASLAGTAIARRRA